MIFLTIREQFKAMIFFLKINMSFYSLTPTEYKMEFLIKMSTEKFYKHKEWFLKRVCLSLCSFIIRGEKYTQKTSLSHRSSLTHEIS
jgi:hypothetical protein